MNVFIAKLGATGDVVRTTTLLRRLSGEITWLTEAKNLTLVENLQPNLRGAAWEQRDSLRDRSYDLIINLEDTVEVANYLKTLHCKQLWGAYVDSQNVMHYTDDSRQWFDLSMISRYGRQAADKLKLKNRDTYQKLIFEGLGFRFEGEKYVLPPPTATNLTGDVAISSAAGPVWPMKKWSYYDELKKYLESQGLNVNVLPTRASLLEHLADVQGHRCLVSGDSLPMHLALGSGVKCVSIFTCTSPWEIHDYGIQKKIVSPVLEEFFYQRGMEPRATTAVSLDEVSEGVMTQLNGTR